MFAALVLIVVGVQSVADVPSPRPAGWVTDQAAILDAPTRARLDAIANELETSRSIELAIVTVDDVPGVPKTFATQLFNHWKIGKAATNNGVLVLLVMGKRRLEIETGTGIEAALTASWLADMQATTMVPRFKQRDFPGGLAAGVEAIAAHLKAAPGEGATTGQPGEYRSDGVAGAPPSTPLGAVGSPSPSPLPSPSVASQRKDSSGVPKPLAFGVGATAIGGGFLFARARRRRRICDKCQKRMLPLDELADDKHLDAGQRREEQVGSVDYEVLICPGCQASRTLRHGRWFSAYSQCPGCSYKTMQSTSTTIVHATYDHGGEVRVDERCSHCSRTNSSTRRTPRRTPPSESSSSSSDSSYSSSSSGGSGFGGGSSSGGGAGSSW